MNYLFGWNAVAEFVVDEFTSLGIPIHGILIEDSYIYRVPLKTTLPVFASSSISFKSKDKVINCLGYKNLEHRIRIGEYLLRLGVLTSFISTKAQVHPSTRIGLGTILVGDVIIEKGCEIGNHGLFWGGSRICHDSKLESGVFLASGSIIGGECNVGQVCSLGFNSSMREKSSMPNGTKVGANFFWRPNR